jgi:hypothetical protein
MSFILSDVSDDEYDNLSQFSTPRNTTRTLQYSNKFNKNPTEIMIRERLVYLGILTKNRVDTILQKNYSDCGRYSIQLNDKNRFISRLGKISKEISAEMKRRTGSLPIIRGSNRTNIYTESDFLNFGDQIILDYIRLKPIETWNIDWDYIDELNNK